MRIRSIVVPLLIFAWTLGVPAQPEPEPDVPFVLPTPDGWREETIPFPLAFAPDIELQGLEELRFAPGMFKKDAFDFWSYAFVWWLADGTELTTRTLERDLTRYFIGLTKAVGQDKGIDAEKIEFATALQPEGENAWRGRIQTFDAFTTLAPVALNVRVRRVSCPGQIAVIFELSPQPTSHAVWTDLSGIRDGFRCAQ